MMATSFDMNTSKEDEITVVEEAKSLLPKKEEQIEFTITEGMSHMLSDDWENSNNLGQSSVAFLSYISDLEDGAFKDQIKSLAVTLLTSQDLVLNLKDRLSLLPSASENEESLKTAASLEQAKTMEKIMRNLILKESRESKFKQKSSTLEYFTDPSQRDKTEELFKSALKVSQIKADSERKTKNLQILQHMCDVCQKLVSHYHKCKVCPDYDQCNNCFKKLPHHHEMEVVGTKTPSEPIFNQAQKKHIFQLSLFFLFNIVAVTFDIYSDFATSMDFFIKGHINYGLATLLPIFAPCVVKLGSSLYGLAKSMWQKNKAKVEVWKQEWPRLIWTWPVIQPVRNIRLFVALFLMDTSLPENLQIVKNIKKEALGSGVLEAFLESAPQLILQSFIVLRNGNITPIQLLSMPVSFLTLSLSSVKLFYSQRLGRSQEVDPNPKMIAFIFPFIILQNIGLLFSLILAASYFKQFALVIIGFIILSNLIVMRGVYFRGRSYPNTELLYEGGLGSAVRRKEGGREEPRSIFLTSIFTSWISPCTVWSNNNILKTQYLIVLSLSNAVLHMLSVSLIYIYTSATHFSIKDTAPLFYCFEESAVDFNDLQDTLALNKSFWSSFNICYGNDACFALQRICSDGEKSTDFFNQVVGPISFLLIILSLASSLCLQFLGNYKTMYDFSKHFFCCCIIAPFNFFHEMLRRPEEQGTDQTEIEELLFKMIEKDKMLLLQKDPLFSETLLHAVFERNSDELLKKMLDLEADFYIENIFGRNVFSLFRSKMLAENFMSIDKQNQIRTKDDGSQLKTGLFHSDIVEEKMKHYFALLNAIEKEKDMQNRPKVWKMEPIREAVQNNSFGRFSFLTILGGNWNSSLVDLLQKLESGDLINSGKFTKWWLSKLVNENGFYLLHLAALNEKPTSLRLLIGCGCSIKVRNSENGMTVFHSAFGKSGLGLKGKTDCLEEILKHSTDVNSADFLGRTPLHLAAQFGNTAVAKLLIENGADVNEVEQDGLTPLHYACKKGDPELLHLLIDRGANVNAMSKNGWTPFWLLNSDEVPESLEGVVMIKQKEECCKILIDSGATTNEEGNI